MGRSLSGALADLNRSRIRSGIACICGIPPGRVVSLSKDHKHIQLGVPEDLLFHILGISVRAVDKENEIYEIGETVPFLEAGSVVVPIMSTGSPGDPLFFDNTTGEIYVGTPGPNQTTLDAVLKETVSTPGDLALIRILNKLARGVAWENQYSIKYDGVSDRILFGNPVSLQFINNFSVSLWFKFGSGVEQVLINKWDDGGVNLRSWQIRAKDRKPIFRIDATGTNNDATRKEYKIDTALNLVTWYQLGFSFNSNVLKVYLNGSEVVPPDLKLDKDGTVNTLFNTSREMISGMQLKDGNPERFFNGNQDEISIWNKALSDAEFAEIWNLGKPANLENHSAVGNLVSWYPFTEIDKTNFPTIRDFGNLDTGGGDNNGTAVNMTANDIVPDVP
jgi:hypothetical protein